MDQEKQTALLWIKQYRSSWEATGQDTPGYLEDRVLFYKYLRHQVLPKWVRKGGNKFVFLTMLKEYARRDWIMSGRNPAEFNATLDRLFYSFYGDFSKADKIKEEQQQRRADRAAANKAASKRAVFGCIGMTIPFLASLIALYVVHEPGLVFSIVITLPIIIFVAFGIHAGWTRFKDRKASRITTLKL